MDEKNAILRLKAGDIGGLETLVRLYQVKAIRTANFITRDLTLAEDVVQDCFLTVYRLIGSFDLNRPFAPWFFRSVINAAIKAAQYNEREKPLEEETDENWFEERLSKIPSAEETTMYHLLEEEIKQALLSLSPRQRAVIVQRYFLDLSEKEMSVELEITPGTVKWLLHHARKRLRALLNERSVK